MEDLLKELGLHQLNTDTDKYLKNPLCMMLLRKERHQVSCVIFKRQLIKCLFHVWRQLV